MIVAEQRETALRLYRLAWRFPEKAPTPKWYVFGDFLYSQAAFITYAPRMLSVSVTCRKTGICTVTIDVDGAQLHVRGTVEHVETVLRLIPDEMRQHVKESE